MNELVKDTIQKLLLSFDDVEFSQSNSNSTNLKISSSIEDWQFIHENFVDLDLPSGTLWMKYNLGATVENTKESWYGNYYAWGELNSKKNFDWKTYKHCNGSGKTLTKYNRKDRKDILDPEDDVVSATMLKKFRMPTKEDFEELCSLSNEWVDNYNGIKGLNGRIFIGNNRNKLFIPATGCRNGRCLNNDGIGVGLWSSSLDVANPRLAYIMFFFSNSGCQLSYSNRYYGFSIRAIL